MRTEDKMTSDLGVVVVGNSPGLRQDVAGVLGASVEAVGLIPSVSAAKEALRRNPPKVLIISSDVDDSEGLSLVRSVAIFSPSTAIIVVRDRELGGLLQVWMRAGARDVVDEWMGEGELREALDRAVAWSQSLLSDTKREPLTSTVTGGELISVFSSKGGSGKTFLACNLALAIADTCGKDTALVDLDFTMGDVFSYFGKEPSRSLQDIIGVGDHVDAETIRSAGTQVHDRLWAFGAPPDPAAEVTPAEDVGKFLRALRRNFQFVVVDTPAIYSDQVLTAFDEAQKICVMASLDVVGIKHLSKALETLVSIGIQRERIQVVLNRADSKVGLSPSDVERVLKIRIDAMIPSSRLVPTSLNKGAPVYIEEPKAEVSVSVRGLAEKLIGGRVAREVPQNGHKEGTPNVKKARRFLGRGQ